MTDACKLCEMGGGKGGAGVERSGASTLVTVATFNERENIKDLIELLLRCMADSDVLIIDDKSPDGTGDVADALARTEPRVIAVHREKRVGLAAALVTGFVWALERGYKLIVNLDADLSHNPRHIPTLVRAMNGADVAIGSRYCNGIRAVKWPAWRLVLSMAATRYVRLVTGMPFSDLTSGFRCFRREAVLAALETPIISRGYSFHIECLHRIWRAGGKVVEVPIVYSARVKGETKITAGIVYEALWVTWLLFWQNRCQRRPWRTSATSAPVASGAVHSTKMPDILAGRCNTDVFSIEPDGYK